MACSSLCTSVRPNVCYIYEVLLTYCYSSKNLINDAFVCLLNDIFVVKYKRLNCPISGPMLDMKC